MRLLKIFKKVFPRGSQGQILVEFALSIPVIFLTVTGAIDFINMTSVSHRVVAAAYEGAKVIPQFNGKFTLDCSSSSVRPEKGKSDNPKAHSGHDSRRETDPEAVNRCSEVISRVKEELNHSGLESGRATVEINYLDGKRVSVDGNNPERRMVGIKVLYPYVHTFGGLLKLDQRNLNGTAYVYLDPESWEA